MNINTLGEQETKQLNDTQKYFYEHLHFFLQKLNKQDFILDKTFYKVSKSGKEFLLELILSPKPEKGISIVIAIDSMQVIIYLDGWHENIEYTSISLDGFYQKIEKLIIFALSYHCKIIEHKSNGKSYKWSLYALEDDSWKLYSTTGLLIYNFFGRRTKEEKRSSIFEKGIFPKELLMA